MTTLNDLKENRNEIIAYLTDELGNENVKEGMNIIAEMIGFRGYEGLNVIDFCKTAIEDNGIKDRIIMSEGRKARQWLEAHNIEASKQLMRNI